MLIYWPHPSALVAMENISICATAYSGLCTACRRSLWAFSASDWISSLPLSQLNGGAIVGCGPVRIFFLSLISFVVPAH